MKVTIQDVLAAGGDIFGLPCKHRAYGEGLCISAKEHGNGDVRFAFPSGENQSGIDFNWVNAADFEVIAGGTLVARHCGDIDLGTRFYAHRDPRHPLRAERLIPQKPVNHALEAAKQDVADAQARLTAAQEKLDEVTK